MKISTAVVIWHDNNILLAQRSKDHYWEFPGGKIDPGETPEECCVREIKEELGINIQLDKFLGKIVGYFRGRKMKLYAYSASWISGKIRLYVHREVRWVDPHDLNEYSLIKEDLEVKKYILSDEEGTRT